MAHHCSYAGEIASSQNIKATLHDGSQLLAEINATTKIKRVWKCKAQALAKEFQCFSMHARISFKHT